MKKYILSLVVLLVLFGLSADALPTVAIFTTGGTIAEKIDPKTGGAVPAVSGKDLIEAVPELKKIANIKAINFSNIDSSQMDPEIWAGLSKKVDEVLQDRDIKGAVITHGTDTMAEGAYFLDLTLKTDKPVVFVGAMRNASEISPDGPANLRDAVTQVCSDNAKGWGVTVTMNQYINSARDVEKKQTTNVQTFKSGEKGYLGYITNGEVIRFNDRLYRVRLPIPKKLPDVPLIKMYPGSDGRFIRHAVEMGVEGIVIEAVGAGNVNAKMYKAIKGALALKIPVVITSSVIHGGVFSDYGDIGGGAMLKKNGAILSRSLKGPKVRLLLMLAIPQGKDIKNYFTL